MTVKLQFNVREVTNPSAMVFELDGTIDSEKSLEKLLEAVAGSEHANVVLSLRNVDYLNSSGFSELVVLYQRSLEMGKAVVLTDLNPKVDCVVRTMGGDKILKIQESEEEALADFE